MAKHSKVVIQRAKHIKQIKQVNLQRDLSQKHWINSRTTSKFTRLLLGVFGFILFVFFVFVVYKKTFGGVDLSFTSFLNWLSTRSNVSIDVHIEQFGVVGNWGLFDGLRIFFDNLAKFTGVLAWLGSNLINIILFLGQFVMFILSA